MKDLESVVIRFSGDSGDGMQLTGTQFSNTSALMGNDIATFPDYPSEIRAPSGTIAGVSGFQVNFGAIDVSTPGDDPDVLVAMNPAALKANIAALRKGGTIIVNLDAFNEAGLKKANYEKNPLETGELSGFQVIQTKVTEQTLRALEGLDLDAKAKGRCKNFYTLGITYFLFNRDLEPTIKWIEQKFGKNPVMAKANVLALKAGFNFGENSEIQVSTYTVAPAKIKPGLYRQVSGNEATAYGFVHAAQTVGMELFLGSYPITPATDILHELSKLKNFNVKTFQAEDEIAGICSSIGAAFGGALAITTTSGPGLALKGEALGLAMIYELPLVIVDVQRGGPSTGLPTKTEQSDLMQAMYGRHGECPLIVVAAKTPGDCFHRAGRASRLAVEHMSPVILLTDGYIANGAEPWRIPDLAKNYSKIRSHRVTGTPPAGEPFLPYKRDAQLVRPWAIPGMIGYEHRIGGLEKWENTGNVSHDPKNHEIMVKIRAEKVAKVADNIPLQELEGNKTGDLLVVSWGGTYGATHAAVAKAQESGKKVSLMHLSYINPMPKNVGELMKGFKRILVPELNMGQLKFILQAEFHCQPIGYNKIQGLPFKITELVEVINRTLES